MEQIQNILKKGTAREIKALFQFDRNTDIDTIEKKFRIWCRYFFPKYFLSNDEPVEDAPFHREIDINNIKIYIGKVSSFLNIVFRGGAKTTRTKLFIAFAIANDSGHFRKYIKILAKDNSNSKQAVTDIYNMFVQSRVAGLYPEIFRKTVTKREETMESFTTATGIKLVSGTVGTEQRGHIQDESRPDLIWFDDFENRKTLRSAVESKSIWDNMEEARTGLAKGGGAIYTCNYLSERGNVHRLVQKVQNKIIIPIIKNGVPTWKRYTLKDVEQIKSEADDFEGEFLCEPSASADVFFDRECLKKQQKKTPIKIVGEFKMFYAFDPSHRYGSGHDIAGGVGLDSSTSVFIDFSTLPVKVVGTYKSNSIKPDVFGDEIEREANYFGEPIVAPENNKFDMVIGRLKQIYKNIYFTEVKETRAGLPPTTRTYGWNTNSMSKPKMLFELKKAVEDGHLELSDEDLINELSSFTRDDLMDREEDVRLTTRHFDLLFACAIALQMKNHATSAKSEYDKYFNIPGQSEPYKM